MVERSDLFQITQEPIRVEEVMQKTIHPNCGAVNVFVGTVRELTFGKRTLFLEYHAYEEMAVKQLQLIGEEIQRKCPEACVAITHRIGRLEITDIAVVIAVATPHRADSYAYSRYAIERIKEVVPIWKKEHWETGEEWVGDAGVS